MKYKTIYLDPAWNESGGGKIKRGADKHYKLMKTKDIIEYCEINIKPLIDDDCHCYLWVTNNFLKDCLINSGYMKRWNEVENTEDIEGDDFNEFKEFLKKIFREKKVSIP